MILLIGKGKNRRVTEQITGLRCPNCGAQGGLLMEGYQEFLVFGLPAFPTSKMVIVTCVSCKKYFPPSEISNEIYHGVQYVKSKIKPAVWMFMLPLIIGSLFLLMLISPEVPTERKVRILLR